MSFSFRYIVKDMCCIFDLFLKLCRFCLSDEYRIGEKICLSPCRGYAAISDNHGRIVLLDIEQGLAVRILKGGYEKKKAILCVTMLLNV